LAKSTRSVGIGTSRWLKDILSMTPQDQTANRSTARRFVLS
jgi:hypothetical protein